MCENFSMGFRDSYVTNETIYRVCYNRKITSSNIQSLLSRASLDLKWILIPERMVVPTGLEPAL